MTPASELSRHPCCDSASVDYKPYSYLVENYAEDVRKRNLPLIKGRYSRMNAVHTVVQVDLQVTL